MVTIRKATKEQIESALNETNKIFEDNILFNRFEQKGKNFNVTLKTKNARGKGSRLGFPQYDWTTKEIIKPGKHMAIACWHVYGVFFDQLFKQNEGIEIVSNGEKITAFNSGNWNDRNIGSQVFPLYYSEACDCNNNGISEMI
jgi:hypothetical protein